MKSNHILFTAIFLLIAFTQNACTNDEDDTISLNSTVRDSCQAETITEFTHDIPLEKALSSLNSFINNSSDYATRTEDDKEIEDIYAVEYQEPTTRSTETGIICKNLLYIVNYKSNKGFAVLAADDRISDDIIAIAEKGRLTRDIIDLSYNALNGQELTNASYPSTGEGFYTMDEYPGEVFMNPNTASLYIEAENDTLVGNFGFDRIGDEEDINLTRTGNWEASEDDIPASVIGSLCLSYAIEEVMWQKVSIDGTIINFPPSLPGYPSTHSDTISTNWNDSIVVEPLLSSYDDWNQYSPFNDYYPKKRLAILFGHKRKAPAGCFPLAISKIMTHFMYPTYYYLNGYQINWTGLRTGCRLFIDSTSAAALLYSISQGCGSYHFYQGTFTFPCRATEFMRNFGFNGARSYDYKDSRVCDMLDNGCPLIIYAMPGINIFHSHAWNIDGYKYKKRTTTINNYSNNTLLNSCTIREKKLMVHCDFGWGGSCNGYYTSGIFKLNDPDAEYDNPYTPNNTYYGRYLLKIVTYDNPL